MTISTSLSPGARAAFDARRAAAGLSIAEQLRRDVAAANAAPPPYLFFDDFTGPTLDTKKWTRETGDSYGQGTFTADPSLAYLDTAAQTLVLLAKKVNGTWTCGQVSTRGTWARQPDETVRIESRFRFDPVGWPGFWASNDAYGLAGGQKGEVDFLEQFPSGPWGPKPYGVTSIHDWVHLLGPNDSRKAQIPYKAPLVDGDWHTLVATWGPGRVEVAIDGVSQGSLTAAQFATQTGGTWQLDAAPSYLLAQMCITGGGSAASYPAPPATVTQARLELDYVKVTKV